MITAVQNNERNPVPELLSGETGNNPVGSFDNNSQIVDVIVDQKKCYNDLLVLKDSINNKYQTLASSCNQ